MAFFVEQELVESTNNHGDSMKQNSIRENQLGKNFFPKMVSRYFRAENYELKHCLFVVLISLSFGLGATVPEYYSVLGKFSSFRKVKQLPPVNEAAKVGAVSPAERERGFVYREISAIDAVRPDFVWKHRPFKQNIETFLSKGEFRNIVVALRSLRALKIEVSATELTSTETGAKISADNIFIQYVKNFSNNNQWNFANTFLFSDFPLAMLAERTAFLVISVHAGRDTPAGIYHGEIKINGYPVPLKLRILNLEFNYPQGAWGSYATGHFYTKITKGHVRNYSPEWYNEKNIKQYLRFLQTRGINSPVFFHVYSRLRLVNGKVQANFPFLSTIAKTMNEIGMRGPFGIDTRFMSWWCHAVADRLRSQKLRPEQVKGDLGISYLDARMSGKEYGELEKKLYGEVIRQLIATAEKEKWPYYLLLTEEEIGHPTYKTKGYEAFNPTLLKVAGRDRVFLIDNSIGYNDTNIDRGQRDNLKIRSYNNWTAKGMADARASRAEIWNYNTGWDRPSSGFRTEQLGASGYHMWALNWQGNNDNESWITTLMDKNGNAISSLELEDFHEGLNDLFYYRLFDEYIEKLKKQGQNKLAGELAAFKYSVFGKVPVDRYKYVTYINNFESHFLDALKYKYLLLIDKARKALNEPSLNLYTASAAKPSLGSLQITSEQAGQPAKSDRIIYAPQITEKIDFDGEVKDGGTWIAKNNLAYGFRFSSTKEAGLKAHAGSVEEFKRLSTPSGVGVRVVYDRKGIYLLAGQNHANSKANSKRESNAPDLWKDDCMEFFFKEASNKATYQLIVNVRGSHTLLKNKKTVPDTGIKVRTKSPFNATGGVQQMIFIPWKDLGRSSPPFKRTVWHFNIGREFHSRKQISSWVQVASSFGVSTGQLCFVGTGDLGTKVRAKQYVQIEKSPLRVIAGDTLELRISAVRAAKLFLRLISGEFRLKGPLTVKPGINIVKVNTKGIKPGIYRAEIAGSRSENIEIMPCPF